MKENIRADGWLLLLTVIWGLSFTLVKTALTDISPILFLAIRFWLGSLLLVPFLFSGFPKINIHVLKRGSLLGLFMFLGMAFQTIGLKYTTASKSGFITGLAVLIVPVLVLIIEKKLPRKASMAGVVLATAGIFLLTHPADMAFNKGDFYTLMCAVCFAFQIIFVEIFVKKGEEIILTFLMLLVTAILASCSVFVFKEYQISFTANMVFSLICVSLLSTALGFWMQIHWQPKTSATAAAVIYTMEPVFALIFAVLLLGEGITGIGLLGGGFIICGMLVAELRK